MADFLPRRVPDETFHAEWRDEFGNVFYVKPPYQDGSFKPSNVGEKRAADAFDLPVARKPKGKE